MNANLKQSVAPESGTTVARTLIRGLRVITAGAANAIHARAHGSVSTTAPAKWLL